MKSGQRHRGFAGTRSLGGTVSPKHQAEKLRPAVRRETDLHARRGDTAAAAARSRLTPSHVTTCAVAAAANASRRFRLESVRQSQPSSRKRCGSLPRPPLAPPTPSPSPPLVPSCTSQLGQRKVIPGREAILWVRLLLLILLSFLLPSPRTLPLPFPTVRELVPSSRLHLFCFSLQAHWPERSNQGDYSSRRQTYI